MNQEEFTDSQDLSQNQPVLDVPQTTVQSNANANADANATNPDADANANANTVEEEKKESKVPKSKRVDGNLIQAQQLCNASNLIQDKQPQNANLMTPLEAFEDAIHKEYAHIFDRVLPKDWTDHPFIFRVQACCDEPDLRSKSQKHVKHQCIQMLKLGLVDEMEFFNFFDTPSQGK